MFGDIGILDILLRDQTYAGEVGLRMAIGAQQVVLLQFLAEAIFISVSGGIAGILIEAAPSPPGQRRYRSPPLSAGSCSPQRLASSSANTPHARPPGSSPSKRCIDPAGLRPEAAVSREVEPGDAPRARALTSGSAESI